MISPTLGINLGTNALLASASVQAATTTPLLTSAANIANQDLAPQAASTLSLIERGRASQLSAPVLRPEPSLFRRLTSGLAGLVLGGLILAGCQFEVGGLAPVDAGTGDADVTTTDGSGGSDGMGGMDGSGGMDAGDAGLPVGPTLVLPAPAQILAPTWAYLYWHDGPIPSGRTIADYQVCSTPNGMAAIDEAAECPNSVVATKNRTVLDPLSPDANYLWKVRARFDDSSNSDWSAIQAFSADHSLVAWWRLNGNATDSSLAGINGAPQNGAGFAAGLDGQALQCDGVNDYVAVSPGLNLAGPLTVSAWINGNGIPASADSGILTQGVANYALTYHTNGQAYFYIGDGTNNIKTPVAPGAWHHVLGTFDGTTNANGLKLYLDAALASMKTSTTATAMSGAAGDLWIGRFGTSYFNGLIDNVTIYNQSLSEAAVLNEYCATQASGGINPLPAACTP